MVWKERVIAAAAITGLIVGGSAAVGRLAPQTPEEQRQQQLDDLTGQAADAKEKTDERNRLDGEGAAEADARDRLRPGENRPPEEHLKLRLRLP